LLPGGRTIPIAALALIAALLAGSTSAATRDVLILTVAGALLYAATHGRRALPRIQRQDRP